MIHFLFAVGRVSESREHDREKCGGEENSISEVRPVCPAYLHCELKGS